MKTTTQQKYNDIEKDFLVSFFDCLNKNEIRYMVLRNYQHLPESLNGSDLDIWVHTDDCERFRSFLKKNVLFVNHGTIVARYGKKCERICIIYGQNGLYNGIQIDLHAGCFLHNGKNIADSDGIYSRRAYFNDIPIPNDTDTCFISFFKELLNNGNGGKTEKYFKSFVETLAKNIQPQESEYKVIFGNKAWNYLKEKSLGQDAPNFSKICKIMRAGLFGSNLFWLFQKVLETMKRLPRVFHPVGFDLIISGTDGAGKTTLINEIQPALKNAFHNGYFYYHMFPGLFPTLSQLLHHKSKTDSKPVVNPHGGKPSGTLVSLFRMFYYSLDYVIGYWVKIYLCMIKKSSIHVFDRYCYDYLLDPQRAAINLPLMIRRAFVFFYPKPALFIYLTADPQIIFERKPELSIEEICRQQKLMKTLQKRMKRAFLLNSDVSIAETVDNAIDIICNQMSCRIK